MHQSWYTAISEHQPTASSTLLLLPDSDASRKTTNFSRYLPAITEKTVGLPKSAHTALVINRLDMDSLTARLKQLEKEGRKSSSSASSSSAATAPKSSLQAAATAPVANTPFSTLAALYSSQPPAMLPDTVKPRSNALPAKFKRALEDKRNEDPVYAKTIGVDLDATAADDEMDADDDRAPGGANDDYDDDDSFIVPDDEVADEARDPRQHIKAVARATRAALKMPVDDDDAPVQKRVIKKPPASKNAPPLPEEDSSSDGGSYHASDDDGGVDDDDDDDGDDGDDENDSGGEDSSAGNDDDDDNDNDSAVVAKESSAKDEATLVKKYGRDRPQGYNTWTEFFEEQEANRMGKELDKRGPPPAGFKSWGQYHATKKIDKIAARNSCYMNDDGSVPSPDELADIGDRRSDMFDALFAEMTPAKEAEFARLLQAQTNKFTQTLFTVFYKKNFLGQAVSDDPADGGSSTAAVATKDGKQTVNTNVPEELNLTEVATVHLMPYLRTLLLAVCAQYSTALKVFIQTMWDQCPCFCRVALDTGKVQSTRQSNCQQVTSFEMYEAKLLTSKLPSGSVCICCGQPIKENSAGKYTLLKVLKIRRLRDTQSSNYLIAPSIRPSTPAVYNVCQKQSCRLIMNALAYVFVFPAYVAMACLANVVSSYANASATNPPKVGDLIDAFVKTDLYKKLFECLKTSLKPLRVISLLV